MMFSLHYSFEETETLELERMQAVDKQLPTHRSRYRAISCHFVFKEIWCETFATGTSVVCRL